LWATTGSSERIPTGSGPQGYTRSWLRAIRGAIDLCAGFRPITTNATAPEEDRRVGPAGARALSKTHCHTAPLRPPRTRDTGKVLTANRHVSDKKRRPHFSYTKRTVASVIFCEVPRRHSKSRCPTRGTWLTVGAGPPACVVVEHRIAVRETIVRHHHLRMRPRSRGKIKADQGALRRPLPPLSLERSNMDIAASRH
jgi:hypothetical protein